MNDILFTLCQIGGESLVFTFLSCFNQDSSLQFHHEVPYFTEGVCSHGGISSDVTAGRDVTAGCVTVVSHLWDVPLWAQG